MSEDTPKARTTRQLYGGYLRQHEWTNICTLTFKSPVSALTAWRRTREWLRDIRVNEFARVDWFAVVEKGEEQENHVHALLNVSPSISDKALRRHWTSGISHIQAYDSTKPGVFYITKTLNQDDADYDLEIHDAATGGVKMKKRERRLVGDFQTVEPPQRGGWGGEAPSGGLGEREKKNTEPEIDLITVQEAARRLSVSQERCYELIRRKILPAVALGRQKRISIRALRRFIKRGGKGL